MFFIRQCILTLVSIMTATVLTYSSDSVAAPCNLVQGKIRVINFGSNLASGLSVARDAPVGTVIYKDIVHTSEYQRLQCDSWGYGGFYVSPTLGSSREGNTFPLGQTGLSFRIIYPEGYYLSAPSWLQEGNKSFTIGNYTLEIIKSGELGKNNKVPAAPLGKSTYDGNTIAEFNLLKPIVLSQTSCQAPSIQVSMGDDYQVTEFNKAGSTPRMINFNVGLTKCEQGINSVTYSLDATSQVLDSQKGIVALDSSSTAKGIGLQLIGETGQPLALGTTYTFAGFNSTTTNFNIPLSATYYRLAGSTLEAGSANASVTFTVNYL